MAHSSVYFENNEKVIFRSDISDEELQNIKDNLHALQDAMTEIDYCVMVRDNIYDFLKDAETNGIGEEKNFVRLNRYMMNWLNAFYAWIQYHERHQKSLFSEIKATYYEAYFEYRLAYAMRKYSTHQALCITNISLDIMTDVTVFKISLPSILQYKSELKADIRKELEDMRQNKDYIDALQFTKNFLIVFEKMQGEIWKRNKVTIAQRAQDLLKATQELDSPILESYIDFGDKNTIPVGTQIHNFIQKLQYIKIPSYLEKYIK